MPFCLAGKRRIRGDPCVTQWPKEPRRGCAACGQGPRRRACAESRPPAGGAARAGHAQRTHRPQAGLPGLDMRRECTACGRGSRAKHAQGLLPDPPIRGGGRGDRPAVPGRVASTCARAPTSEPRAQPPCRPTCQKTWRVVPRACHSYTSLFCPSAPVRALSEEPG